MPSFRPRLLVAGVLSLSFCGCHLIFPFEPQERDVALDGASPVADLRAGDGPAQDAPPLTCAEVIGRPCTDKTFEVCGPFDCVATNTDHTAGVCTCECTQDDPATPTVDEDNCPDTKRNVCAEVVLKGGSVRHYCFQKCSPRIGANECQEPLACALSSPYTFRSPGYHAVCAFHGCTENWQCPVRTAKACTDEMDCDTSNSEYCLDVVYGSPQASRRCARPGKCDLLSGLCDKNPVGLFDPDAKVGDPCDSDLDCGAAMSCVIQVDTAAYLKRGGEPCFSDRECCSERCEGNSCAPGLCTIRFRNGYCTITGCAYKDLGLRACPAGSDCNLIYRAGLCQMSCSVSDPLGCRDNIADLYGDYECRSWDNVDMINLAGSPQAASGPVCDFGTWLSCAYLDSSGIPCAELGDVDDSTKMRCRDLYGNIIAPSDPLGFCLDTTVSGKMHRPMPMP
jgi:hypothetical protein